MSRSPTPVAYSVPFDNATNGFASDNVQQAIEEARVTSSAAEQFSHSGVDSNFIIPLKRQMFVYQEMEIEPSYEIEVLGELVLLE
jgi:hypothetical protein